MGQGIGAAQARGAGSLTQIQPRAWAELPSRVPVRCHHLQWCWEATRALLALGFSSKEPRFVPEETVQAGMGGT